MGGAESWTHASLSLCTTLDSRESCFLYFELIDLFYNFVLSPLFYSSTWLIFIDFALRTLINSSPLFNLLMSPLKEIFISITVFLISGVSIWLFLMVSTPQLKLPIWFCILSTFSIIVSNILILVILNFLSNYNICVLSESVFDDWFISSKQLFFLSFCVAHCSLIENWISCLGHRYYFRDKHAFPSAFNVRFSVNLIRSLAEFQVWLSSVHHRLQIPLVTPYVYDEG